LHIRAIFAQCDRYANRKLRIQFVLVLSLFSCTLSRTGEWQKQEQTDKTRCPKGSGHRYGAIWWARFCPPQHYISISHACPQWTPLLCVNLASLKNWSYVF